MIEIADLKERHRKRVTPEIILYVHTLLAFPSPLAFSFLPFLSSS